MSDTQVLRRSRLVALVLALTAFAIVAACSSASKAGAGQPAAASASPNVAEATATATVAFVSNGCSGFREARFFSCCFTHDLTFWAGGNRGDRRRADLALRQCLIDISHNKYVANLGYFLVVLWTGVGEVWDTGWARAWRGTGHGRYDSLSSGQKLVVAAQRKRVCDGLRLNPETGRYRVDDSTDPVREVWPAQKRLICGQ